MDVLSEEGDHGVVEAVLVAEARGEFEGVVVGLGADVDFVSILKLNF